MSVIPSKENKNIEFKEKLSSASHLKQDKKQHLSAQMKYLLEIGKGTAVYVIGIDDDGNPKGLSELEFGDLYSGFEEINESPSTLSKLGIQEKWHEAILGVLKKNFIEKEFELKAELQMSSYEGDGVEMIKKLLQSLEKNGISVSYISAPKYRLGMKTKNPKADTRKFEQEIQKITSEASKINVDVSYSMVQ